jgi:hypothetical protein
MGERRNAYRIKVKGKVVPVLNLYKHYAMMAYGGSGCIDPHFLDLGTSQLHVPAALPPGKSSWYPLYRRLGGPQSRSGRYGEMKILAPIGTRTPTSWSPSPLAVAIPTMLFRLHAYILVGKLEERRPLGRPRRRWVDNIKMDLREIEYGMDWVDLAQDKDRWRALVNMVMNLRVP